MSKEENNDTNRKLRELLQSNNTSNSGDFEKEALEGYSMLGSLDDAIKLKSELDGKMARTLGEKQKSRPRTLYWVAAACVLFITSFSFYYILTNNSAESELAVTNVNREPQFEPALPSANPDVLPAESAKQPAEPRAQISAPQSDKKAETSTAPGRRSAAKIAATANAREEELSEDKLPEEMAIAANNGGVTFTAHSPSPGEKDMTYSPHQQVPSGKMAAQRNKNYAPAAMAAPVAGGKSTASVISYQGGDAALNADLEKILEKAGLNRQFDAVIHLNKLQTVSKVEITDPSGLDLKQQDQLKKILGDLDKFIYPQGEEAETLPYLIKYRP
jgi:hypothetical protein